VEFKVDFTPQALEDISKLDKAISGRVIKRVEWLSEDIEIINPQALKGKF
jgi:mRNA-degrading endonuclease RelE of RelBE toxin-antitoxin system